MFYGIAKYNGNLAKWINKKNVQAQFIFFPVLCSPNIQKHWAGYPSTIRNKLERPFPVAQIVRKPGRAGISGRIGCNRLAEKEDTRCPLGPKRLRSNQELIRSMAVEKFCWVNNWSSIVRIRSTWGGGRCRKASIVVKWHSTDRFRGPDNPKHNFGYHKLLVFPGSHFLMRWKKR